MNGGTALLSDAAFRAAIPFEVGPPGLTTLHTAWSMAGPAVTVQANNDLPTILLALHRAPQGSVLVIAARPPTAAVIGDLVATEGRRRGLAGIVVDGFVRDRADLDRIGLPVAALGTYPIGPLKSPDRGIGAWDVVVGVGEARISPGDLVVADADGVVVFGADVVTDLRAAAREAIAAEAAIADALAAGRELGDLLGIEAFVERRAHDPSVDFNDHLRDGGGAI